MDVSEGLPGLAGGWLAGRGPELAGLEGDLRSASEAGFRVSLVTGDPGVGKTRLVGVFSDVQTVDVTVLRARAYSLGATASLAVWVEALDRHLRMLDPATVRELTVGAVDELGVLVPTVASAVGVRIDRDPPRIRILASLAVLFERLAQRTPLLIHVDDAHLADGSSWEALSYLAHNLAASPILVVLTARAGELGDNAAALEVLSSLEQDGRLLRRSLMPLPRDGVSAVAAAMVGASAVTDGLVQWLMERARGNPLFTTELLAAAVEEECDLSRPSLRRLPESLTARIEARLVAMSTTERTVVEVLAVVGQRVPYDELEELIGLSPPALLSALEHLVRLRLVAERDNDSELTYEMAHPLIADAVYANIGGARRRALHRTVGRALVAADRPGAAAAHFARSADIGDPEAVSTLVTAFHQAETRELPREAMAILDALLDLLPDGDPRWSDVFDAMRPQAPWIVDHRTDVAATTGTRAMLAIERVIAAGPDKVRLALVKFNLASFDAWGSGDLAAARRRIEDALALLEAAGARQMALLAANELGYLTGLEGNLDGHERQAREVLAEADVTGDRFVALQALCSLALALLWSGQLAESFPPMERALSIARAEQYPYRVTYVLALQGFAESLQGRTERSRDLMIEAMAANPAYRDTLLPDLRASSCWMNGDLTDGAAWAVELSGWLTSGAVSRRRSFGAVFAALCLLELGRTDQTLNLLEQATRPFGTSRWWLYGHLLAWANAVVTWRMTRTADAAAGLLAAADAIVAVGGSMLAPLVVADLAEAAADRHDPHLAAHATELQQQMVPPDSIVFRALRSVVAAVDAGSRGDVAEAIGRAEQAARAFDRAGWRLWAGRALMLAGTSAAATDRGRASDLLAGASDVLATIGAIPRQLEADAACAALDRRGRQPAHRMSRSVDLTPREREVASMAADGLSAKEIAARLFIGKRTVETHLAHAYTKLGVNSRFDLARALQRVEGPSDT
jgi:DNA-binding CsgD family transcriptional regulator/tetratricopeptide (TPR) repeat protein